MEGIKRKPDIILGYIDHNDVVHSQSFSFKKDALSHKQVYGMVLRGWRWEFTTGFASAIKYGVLDSEDVILIKDYLKKKYRIDE